MKKKIADGQAEKNSFFSTVGRLVAKNWKQIAVFLAALIVVSILNFFNVATTQTVAAFRITEFEVGQNADRTIIANKSIPADIENPVSVIDGEKIIRKGFDITEEQYAKLRKLTESPDYFDVRAFANTELFLIALALIWLFLFMFVPFGRKIQIREIIMQIVFFCLVYAASAFGQKLEIFSSPYMLPIILPCALCVLLLTILYGQFSAVLFSFMCALGVFCATLWQPVPFLFALFTSLTSAWIVRKIERRIDMIFASFILALLDCVFVFLLAVVFNDELTGMLKPMGFVAFNGFVSGILALGLLTPFEMLLNTASVFRLMDLSDLNAPEMRKMLLTASGTYNHSLMVAQLAESACREIGANPLVARVGGYYHDIGKIEQSEYFVENQSDGVNKHDDINPSLSVAVIKSHVKKGVERAMQLRLPDQIIDIISEHHGNSVITYFYNEMKEKDSSVSPEDFSYPGIPPTSKESGVVMLADTVEAACRTLENPSVTRLEKFIQTLIDGKIEHKQLNNCSLTFGDIAKVKAAFVQILAAYHHNRIKYQNQKDPDADNAENAKSAENPAEKSDSSVKEEKQDSKSVAQKEKNNG